MAAPTQELASPRVRWDLSALFSSVDDPKVEQTWAEIHRMSDSFAARYRGKIERDDLSAETLLTSIRELEEISQAIDKPTNYSHLLFAADCADPKFGAFMQSQMEKYSEVRVKLMFFELELQKTPESTIEKLLSDPHLSDYRHYIQVARTYTPHMLSETEEVLLEEVANTGSRAWVRLFEEVTSNHVYKLKRPGSEETENMSQEEILTLLRHSDRAVRQAAADAFSAGLAEQQRVVTFVYNNLLQDRKVADKLRKHPYPEHSRHLSNELEKATVDLVTGLCKEHHKYVERFYNVKKQILGLPELTHIDRYAPLFEAEHQVAWEHGREIVLESFAKFSQEMSDRAREFFDKSWIDAESRPGKTGGAFCNYNTTDTHPVVLMSYLNKMSDVMTLAHELGHGVHASFSREQSPFNFHGTLPLAELASIFGEMLVFERLVSESDLKDKVALYAEKIEGIFASTFRQASMYRFEQRSHQKRRAEGELTPADFGDIWQDELQSMFGSSLKLGEQHRQWWQYVGHFFFAPFYVYAYAFGELLTLSIYQMAKEQGPGFADKYVALLKLGGSKTPQELMATIGVDLNSKEFWMGGFRAIDAMVTEFERLWTEYSKA